MGKNICLPKGSEKIDEGLDKKVQTVGYCTLKLKRVGLKNIKDDKEFNLVK